MYMSNRPNFYHDVPVWQAKFLSKCTCLTGQISIMMYLSDGPNFYHDVHVWQAQFLWWYTCLPGPISIMIHLSNNPNLYHYVPAWQAKSLSHAPAVLCKQCLSKSRCCCFVKAGNAVISHWWVCKRVDLEEQKNGPPRKVYYNMYR